MKNIAYPIALKLVLKNTNNLTTNVMFGKSQN